MHSLFDRLPLLWAVLGIGLVIFVHEAGHFIAARICKVRVDVFSLGFGPRLLGWKRGATLYQIALIPLGGYVKMAGEELTAPGERRSLAPDELAAKSVGQRFFIYSGGVLMNLLFAVIVLPIVLAVGVPSWEPVLGPPVPGSVAWEERIPAGTRVLTVNGSSVFDFLHIPTEVAISGRDDVEMEVLFPGAALPQTVTLSPRYDAEIGLHDVGVSPSTDFEGRIDVAPGSPAAAAGLETDDRVLGVEGMSPYLSLDEQMALAFGARGPITLRIERDGAERTVTVRPEPHSETSRDRLVGVEPASVLLADTRPDPVIDALGLVVGDRLREVDGVPINRSGDVQRALLAGAGSPVRIVVDRRDHTLRADSDPDALSELESKLVLEARSSARGSERVPPRPAALFVEAPGDSRLARALGLSAGDQIVSVQGDEVFDVADFEGALERATGPSLSVVVRRPPELVELVGPVLDEQAAVALSRDLYVARDLDRTRIAVLPGAAAEEAGLRDGDEITSFDGTPVHDWDSFQALAGIASRRGAPVRMTVRRETADGGASEIRVELTPREVVPLVYGFGLRQAQYVYKADSLTQAIEVGVASSWRLLVESGRTLSKMVLGEVSPKHLGGIITIGFVSTRLATQGMSKLFFFLCLLSINLAFLNVLPIPILDGGHLFFLAIEKLKGSPVSERTLGYSQIVGLVLIVSLMVYVTYNDVARWFFGS